MNKIIKLASIMAIAVTTSLSFAQTATTRQQQHLTKSGKVDKRYKASADIHTKADGTPDKRYKENAAANGQVAASTRRDNDRSADSHYKANQPSASASGTVHTKADGTPDRRYKNAPVATTTQPTARPSSAQPAHDGRLASNNEVHLKKDGTPDMRYKENRKNHLNKDGSVDKRYKH